MLFYTARARRGIQELRRLGPQFRLRFLCSPGAYGASAPLGSAIRRRLPLVALLALPPYLGIGAGGILFGRAVIFASIPLSKQFRMLLGKGLMPNLFMMAYRAAFAMDASIHCRLPCMPLLAFPPDPLAASGRHVLRGQRRIFLPHPTLWQFQGLCGRKAVLCRGSVAGAIRAPISAQVPFGRCCLPLVPFLRISTKLVCCSTEKSVPASTAHFCLCANPLPTRAQDMPASLQPKPFGYCSKGRPFLRPGPASGLGLPPTHALFRISTTPFCWNKVQSAPQCSCFSADAIAGQAEDSTPPGNIPWIVFGGCSMGRCGPAHAFAIDWAPPAIRGPLGIATKTPDLSWAQTLLGGYRIFRRMPVLCQRGGFPCQRCFRLHGMPLAVWAFCGLRPRARIRSRPASYGPFCISTKHSYLCRAAHPSA